MKPLDGFQGGGMNAHIVHPGDEIERITAMFTFAETVPDVFTDAHPELGRVAPFVNRTRTAQVVSAPFELVDEMIVRQHLFHGDGPI